MRVVGLVAGVTELVVGIPLAVATAQQLGRFSLFALAPIACLILIILFVWPGVWNKLTKTGEESLQTVTVITSPGYGFPGSISTSCMNYHRLAWSF